MMLPHVVFLSVQNGLMRTTFIYVLCMCCMIASREVVGKSRSDMSFKFLGGLVPAAVLDIMSI